MLGIVRRPSLEKPSGTHFHAAKYFDFNALNLRLHTELERQTHPHVHLTSRSEKGKFMLLRRRKLLWKKRILFWKES